MLAMPNESADATGVLSTGAAKRAQSIAIDVVPAFDGDFLDGIGHLLDSNGDGVFCQLLLSPTQVRSWRSSA